MLTSILSQIGIPALTSIVGSALEEIDSPIAKTASEALDSVGEAFKEGSITAEQIESLNNHAQAMAKIKLKEYKVSLSQINETLRAEAASQDLYVRRMRPTFGYIMAFTWLMQMLGIAYIMIFDTAKVGVVLNAMGALSMIWSVGLSVLGVYVYKRSEEKKTQGAETIYWNQS